MSKASHGSPNITEDLAARAYIAKCDDLIANPPENWQDVWVITTK